MRLTQAEIVAAVRKHALENYETGGWDSIVECYDDADIIREMGAATTAEEAIRNVGRLADIWDDRRQDIQAEAF